MNNQLAHIFDNSVCLSKRQLRDYVAGNMGSEECHALELHLNSCPFCSEAVEGLQGAPKETLATLTTLNNDFLQEHFALHTPQVHLNSMAPAASMPVHSKKKNKVQPLWRNASIAAALLVSFGLMWYLQYGRERRSSTTAIAQQEPSPAVAPAGTVTAADQEIAAAPAVVAEKEIQQPATSGKKSESGNSPQKPQLLIGATSHKEHKETGREEASSPAAGTVAAADERKVSEVSKESLADVATPAVAAYDKEEPEASPTANRAIAPAPKTLKSKMMAAPAVSAAKKTAPETVHTGAAKDAAVNADDQYKNGNYNAALRQYNKDINNTDRARRHTAMLGAARCYAQQGQKTKAVALLNSIISEGGAEKHSAKALLRKLNKSDQ